MDEKISLCKTFSYITRFPSVYDFCRTLLSYVKKCIDIQLCDK